jgi:hypothetical protein
VEKRADDPSLQLEGRFAGEFGESRLALKLLCQSNEKMTIWPP